MTGSGLFFYELKQKMLHIRGVESSRAAKAAWRSRTLDLPLRGTKAREYYYGFVANAPRKDGLCKGLVIPV